MRSVVTVDPTARRSSPRWWIPFVTGAALGLVAGLVLGVRRGTTGAAAERAGSSTDAGDQGWTERALAGAARGLGQAREKLRRPVVVDLEALRRRVSRLPAGGLVRMRDLGDGIIEVVGSAPDDAQARAVLDAVAAEPGVEVVVNRVWTPSSAVRNVPGP